MLSHKDDYKQAQNQINLLFSCILYRPVKTKFFEQSFVYLQSRFRNQFYHCPNQKRFSDNFFHKNFQHNLQQAKDNMANHRCLRCV